jgi:hypothetical protein
VGDQRKKDAGKSSAASGVHLILLLKVTVGFAYLHKPSADSLLIPHQFLFVT